MRDYDDSVNEWVINDQQTVDKRLHTLELMAHAKPCRCRSCSDLQFEIKQLKELIHTNQVVMQEMASELVRLSKK